MNEQLVDNNCGPIDNAAVEFKRVSTFTIERREGSPQLAAALKDFYERRIISSGAMVIAHVCVSYSRPIMVLTIAS